VLPNHTTTARYFCGLLSAHVNKARDLGNLKDNAKMVNEQAAREIEVVEEEAGDTRVSCAHWHSAQLTPI